MAKTPRRPDLTYESFAQHLSRHLDEHGTVPTIAELIEALGGSATTVSRFKRRFLDETHDSDGPPLPDPLDTAVRRGVTALWQELEEGLAAREGEMERQVDKKTAAAEETVQTAYAARDEAKSKLEQLAQQLAAAEERLNDQAKELSALTTAHHALDTQLASETTRNKSLADQLVTRAAEVDKLTAALAISEQRSEERATQLVSVQTTHTETLERREQRHAEALAELKQDHGHEVTDYRQRIDSLDKKLTELEQERIEQLNRASRAQGELVALTQQQRETEEQRAIDLEQLIDIRSECERLRTERDVARREQQLIEKSTETLVTEKEARIVSLEQGVNDLRRALEQTPKP